MCPSRCCCELDDCNEDLWRKTHPFALFPELKKKNAALSSWKRNSLHYRKSFLKIENIPQCIRSIHLHSNCSLSTYRISISISIHNVYVLAKVELYFLFAVTLLMCSPTESLLWAMAQLLMFVWREKERLLRLQREERRGEERCWTYFWYEGKRSSRPSCETLPPLVLPPYWPVWTTRDDLVIKCHSDGT